MSSAPFRTLGRGVSDDGSSSFKRALGKVFKPLQLPRLIDKSSPGFSAIKRFGVSTLSGFFNDPFHTLLNLPWGTFIFVFFSTYTLQYILFAFLYWVQGSCVRVEGTDKNGNLLSTSNTFQRSLWMSSRVASTLGFTEVRPDPDCSFVNFCVMCQVIFSTLINYMLLGVVFARFSAPFKRASTVRFSKVATISRHPSGFWALTMRVANLRKHQILQPQLRLVVTAADSITPSYYQYEQLQVEGAYKQLTNLELGFPSHITHVITPDSFLYNLSLLEMDTRMMEILVFVDGIDAMTSRHMSARIAYSTSDIYMNEQFAPMNLEMRGKQLGLDFSSFDKTLPALDPALLLDLNEASNNSAAGGGQGVGLWQLRHQTFRKLAERYAHLGVSHTAVIAAAAVTGENGMPPSDNHTSVEISHANQNDAGGDMHHGLLGSNAQPSHLSHVSASMLASGTSGMPFAVSKAGTQEKQPGLASIFSINKPSSPTSSAWTSHHSDALDVSGTNNSAGKEVFVPISGIQRGAPAQVGNAWQQSSIPLSPMPVLGAPPATLAGQHVGNDRVADSPTYTGPGAAARPLLYTLDEEAPAPRHHSAPAVEQKASHPLPPSQNARG